jgi:hypothetical protein
MMGQKTSARFEQKILLVPPVIRILAFGNQANFHLKRAEVFCPPCKTLRLLFEKIVNEKLCIFFWPRIRKQEILSRF